jgi:hypothetical protein
MNKRRVVGEENQKGQDVSVAINTDIAMITLDVSQVIHDI